MNGCSKSISAKLVTHSSGSGQEGMTTWAVNERLGLDVSTEELASIFERQPGTTGCDTDNCAALEVVHINAR